MILVINGIERELTNSDTIKIFREAGWEEKIEEIKSIEEEQSKTTKKTTKKKK